MAWVLLLALVVLAFGTWLRLTKPEMPTDEPVDAEPERPVARDDVVERARRRADAYEVVERVELRTGPEPELHAAAGLLRSGGIDAVVVPRTRTHQAPRLLVPVDQAEDARAVLRELGQA